MKGRSERLSIGSLNFKEIACRRCVRRHSGPPMSHDLLPQPSFPPSPLNRTSVLACMVDSSEADAVCCSTVGALAALPITLVLSPSKCLSL